MFCNQARIEAQASAFLAADYNRVLASRVELLQPFQRACSIGDNCTQKQNDRAKAIISSLGIQTMSLTLRRVHGAASSAEEQLIK